MNLFLAARQALAVSVPGGASGERSARRCASLVSLASSCLLLAVLTTGPAFAGATPRVGSSDPSATPANASAAKPAREPTPRRLTKFEARRIRHACYGRANESSLRGAEREAFLTKCYFGRVSHRVERQQCRQQAAAQGMDKVAAREFVRECVKERVRLKGGKAISE